MGIMPRVIRIRSAAATTTEKPPPRLCPHRKISVSARSDSPANRSCRLQQILDIKCMQSPSMMEGKYKYCTREGPNCPEGAQTFFVFFAQPLVGEKASTVYGGPVRRIVSRWATQPGRASSRQLESWSENHRRMRLLEAGVQVWFCTFLLV